MEQKFGELFGDVSAHGDQAIRLLMIYGPKLILAVLVLIVGLWCVGVLSRWMKKILNGRHFDPSLSTFLISFATMTLKILLVISVAGMIGVEMTSFIALLGAAGLAVGMALSGTLQNFAGGIVILVLKPFRVGDVIEAQGFIGKVSEIQIFNTILKTADNKTIVLPNSPIATGTLINYSTEPTRRVDFVFGVGYGDDLDKTRRILLETITQDPRVLKEPEPFVAVGELAASSVNFYLRVWVKSDDYWAVYFDTFEKVKKAFDRNGISIPFPQRDVHLYQTKTGSGL